MKATLGFAFQEPPKDENETLKPGIEAKKEVPHTKDKGIFSKA